MSAEVFISLTTFKSSNIKKKTLKAVCKSNIQSNGRDVTHILLLKMRKGSEFKLNNLPSDYISSIKFHKTYNHLLLVSSWDCAVRLYDTDANSLKYTWPTDDPNLDALFMGPNKLAYGGVSGVLNVRDTDSNTVETVGSHGDAIKNVEYLPNKNVLITGSWDKTVKVWDLRQQGSVATYEQCDGRVYSMSVVDEKIAVGTSESKALIWDMRNMSTYLILHRLQHRVNCIAMSPCKECYAIGHVDGRVAIKYINKNEHVRKLRTTFKCHRMIEGEYEHVFSVTTIRFYNEGSILATGGGNGFVNVWNCLKNCHVGRFPRHEMAVTSIDFSPDRSKLAVACSEQSLDAFRNRPLAVEIKVWYLNERKIRL